MSEHSNDPVRVHTGEIDPEKCPNCGHEARWCEDDEITGKNGFTHRVYKSWVCDNPDCKTNHWGGFVSHMVRILPVIDHK